MEACHLPQSANNRDRIQKSSVKIIHILNIMRWLIPIVAALIWIFINRLPADMQHEMLPEFIRLPLPALNCLLGFIVSMIPAGITIYGLTILIRLFRLYHQGKIFHFDNVRCLQILSRILIAICFAGILTDTLMSLALTIHHPKGERMLSIGMSSSDITALIIGYILSIIARVMLEGCKLQQEQDLTV